jgi:DNA-binding transcriptional LysR family regulator
MGDIQLRRLRYFVAVAEELHFGRAARRLNIAQPPLSQQIQRLEAELGLQLFRRYPRRVELTRGGKLLLEQAESLLAHAAHVDATMRCAAEGLAGPLTIGFAPTAGHALLPTILRAFHERYPKVQLTLHEQDSICQYSSLPAGRIDVGIVRQLLPQPGITLEPLPAERVVAALPTSHPLSAGSTVSLAAMRDEDFVFLARTVGASWYELLLASCQAAGFTPHIRQEVSDPPSLISLVSAGLYVALVPESFSAVLRPHVVYRAIADLDASVDFALAFRTDGHDLIIKGFCDVAREVAADANDWIAARLNEAGAVLEPAVATY